jgi:hypothetical protein
MLLADALACIKQEEPAEDAVGAGIHKGDHSWPSHGVVSPPNAAVDDFHVHDDLLHRAQKVVAPTDSRTIVIVGLPIVRSDVDYAIMASFTDTALREFESLSREVQLHLSGESPQSNKHFSAHLLPSGALHR